MKNICVFYLKIFIFLEVKFSIYLNRLVFVMVAQLDARPTGDQEVAASTPAGPATFFR